MPRLPYGTSKYMTDGEKREYRREQRRKYHAAHRDEINARNKRFFDLWSKTKPFTAHCRRCGADFKARRRSSTVCPDCHQKAHEHYISEIKALAERKAWRKQLSEQVVILNKTGLLQQEIADKLGISQRSVSYLLIKNGIRTQKYSARKNKVI